MFLRSDAVKSSEESSETEESGDGSGDFLTNNLSRKERDSGPEAWLQQIENEEEGSTADVTYSNDIVPEAVKPKLTAEDLREENMIE